MVEERERERETIVLNLSKLTMEEERNTLHDSMRAAVKCCEEEE